MRVQCIAELPNAAQAKRLGQYFSHGKQEFYLVLGKEYSVFSLRVLGGLPWIDLVSDSGYLYPAPLLLFRIVDRRISQYWEIKYHEDDTVEMQPHSFYQKFYHDDLLEGVHSVVLDFQQVRHLIETEFDVKD